MWLMPSETTVKLIQESLINCSVNVRDYLFFHYSLSEMGNGGWILKQPYYSCWGWKWGMTADGHKGTLWSDEKVLKPDCGSGCTTL